MTRIPVLIKVVQSGRHEWTGGTLDLPVGHIHCDWPAWMDENQPFSIEELLPNVSDGRGIPITMDMFKEPPRVTG